VRLVSMSYLKTLHCHCTSPAASFPSIRQSHSENSLWFLPAPHIPLQALAGSPAARQESVSSSYTLRCGHRRDNEKWPCHHSRESTCSRARDPNARFVYTSKNSL